MHSSGLRPELPKDATPAEDSQLGIFSDHSFGEVERTKSYEEAKERLSLQQDQISAFEPAMESVASAPVSEDVDETSTTSCFARFVKSWKFEAFFASVLVSNAIFLGVQTQWTSMHLDNDLPAAFLTMQMAYAILFILEILLRLAAWGPTGFFCAKDWAWHLLDIVVSATAVLDLAAVVAGMEAKPSSSSSGFRLLRIMKIARLARAIRMVKVLRFIRALRVLVFSILYTLRSLVWSLVLLLVIIYAFSILFSDAAIDHALESGLAERLGCRYPEVSLKGTGRLLLLLVMSSRLGEPDERAWRTVI